MSQLLCVAVTSHTLDGKLQPGKSLDPSASPLTPTGPPLPLEFSMIEHVPNTAVVQPTQIPMLKLKSGPFCPCCLH
jgi:hypothetical protein